MTSALVVGASGATGRLLVGELLDRGVHVRAVVRSPDRLPKALRDHERLSLIVANVLDLTDTQMGEHVKGCGAVASCLGHTLSFRGVYGPPRRLVTDATRRLCEAIAANRPQRPVRFVLMNTAGNSNRDLDEQVSLGQATVIWLLRLLLPPHVDNEKAADYLRLNENPTVQWAAVRPDDLIDADHVTEYELHASPIRSAIFDAGKTSRINVAHFMAELMTDDEAWNAWEGRMPVIYNR